VEWVELGRIRRPFGVKGWLHVESFTDPPEALLDYRQWMVRRTGGARAARTVAEGRPHAHELVVRLDGVENRQAAQELVGAVIEVARGELPPTKAREYYRADLLGLAVSNREGVDLGVLAYFVEAANGVMMVIKQAAGEEHWVPAAPEYLWHVDLAAGRIIVDWSVDSAS
jgi:16S rRNA processing protein RimM